MADDAETPSRDYRETVFLPDTPFPMRAGLPQKEPLILEQWAKADLYNTMRKARQHAGAPLYCAARWAAPMRTARSISAMPCRKR